MTTPPEIPDEIWNAFLLAWEAHSGEEIVDQARAALSAVAPMLTEPLKAEIKRLHARLEDDHVFRFDKGTEEFIREEVESGSIPDGIEARDCTIKLQDEEIARLKAQAPMLRAQGMREAAKCQPCTAEDPNETAYQRGKFDGIIEFGTAILARAAEIEGGKGSECN